MQGAFDFYRDLPARPERPERLIFMAFPDTETSLRIGQFGSWFICKNDLEGRRLEAGRLHVSLHHVGDYKRLRAKFIFAARQAGKAVSMQPFEITFRRIKSFESAPGKWPLVLLGEGDALFALHKILGAAMKKSGLRAAESFVPHMTLSYGSRPVTPQVIEPIRIWVNEFALIHSELWRSKYNTIDRWPLRG